MVRTVIVTLMIKLTTDCLVTLAKTCNKRVYTSVTRKKSFKQLGSDNRRIAKQKDKLFIRYSNATHYGGSLLA